jgi:hypothetical protein
MSSRMSLRSALSSYRSLPALVVVLGVLALAAVLILATRTTAGFPAKGRFVEVDNHRFYLACAGKGRPVVVLEAGLGDWSRGSEESVARALSPLG